MFLKRNKSMTALFLTALLFLCAGLGLETYSRQLSPGDGSVTETQSTMAGITDETEWTSVVECTTDWTGQEATTGEPTVEPAPEPFVKPGESRHPRLDRQSVQLIAWGCALAAAVLGGIFSWIGKGEKHLLGPDGELAALGGIVLMILLLRDVFWYEPWVMFLVGLVLGSVGLVLLRAIVQWGKNGFPWGWMGCHRLGRFLSGNRAKWYVPVQLGLIAGAAGLVWLIHPSLWWLRAMIAVAGWFPVWALIVLAKSADELAFVSEQVCNGQEPAPGDGFFSGPEQELSQLRLSHAEAVRKAVMGERFKVELISNVSHDLRTPLTAILGYAELLKKEHLSEEGEKQLTQLNRKAGYMKDLVDDLFELTKVSSGVSQPNMVKIDLIRLLEQTMGLLDDRFQAVGLTVKRHYESDALELVTDGSRMHQVFVNLMENAIKYALPGSRIHLYVRGGTVRLINVASYEMDFSADEIVERFARGDKARSSQGSGIGLAIAQTYTQSVGGSFRVEIDGDQFSAIVELPLQ